MKTPVSLILALGLFASSAFSANPILDGWYADPEVAVFNDAYWIFPTYSAPYDEQLHFDAFSSKDLVTWKKHPRVLEKKNVSWAKRALWAPSVVEKDGKYYFFFAANDVKPGEEGGIGVAVSDKPQGPYKDYLGKPLISENVNGAQPIDQAVFQDPEGQWWIVYGGWQHCNLARLSDDFKEIVPFANGDKFREITPEGYVEGPLLFWRNGKVYFMWSEGGWGSPDYKVAYAMADSLDGPFERIGTILEQDPDVATSAGHHSVLNVPGTDDWYIVYHRRPLDRTDRNHRVTCIDRMEFNADGTIKPVKMTFTGVKPHPLP